MIDILAGEGCFYTGPLAVAEAWGRVDTPPDPGGRAVILLGLVRTEQDGFRKSVHGRIEMTPEDAEDLARALASAASRLKHGSNT